MRAAARVADAFESNSPLPAPSFAASTSDQVREILEAAERSVADVRARANDEASDHVARVQAATAGMLAKLDHLESELNRLLTALRTSAERLDEGLADLQTQVAGGTFAPAADAAPAPEPEADAVPTPEAEAPPAPEPADASAVNGSAPATADAEPAADDAASHPPAVAGDSLFDVMPADDADGARLIALNMALSGSSREDTALFLAEHFDLPDLEALLDDVYARAGQ